MVAQTRHAGQSPKKKLVFHEKLVGKGLSTDALLKKLKALHTELAALDQEHVDVSSLSTVRKELVNTSILLHKDRGVKAYAACCLADILRLYAPDAPYTQSELRDIFQFFFRQLTNGLKGADASYYNEYFHLLESLSTVKSVVLVCDLPSAEDLMSEIFRDFFNLVRRDLPKKIELFMVDILVALIDECQVLPGEVLETILSQFMENNMKIEQAGHRLAVQVCNATADKLQRHVCQHFTDIIVSNSREEDFTEIRNAHELIKRLHHSCPGLLQSVIPQLEEELRVEEVTLRVLATQVLGEMFADKGGGELIKKYPATWNLWIQRRIDKSAAVRLKFVEAARSLLLSLFEQKELIEESLHLKLLDPDEKVRAAVCKIYGQIDYETALHHVSESQLRAVSERVGDKKQAVRIEASTSLGKLYSLAYPEIENNEPVAITHFSWIPSEILKKISLGPDVRVVVEQTMMEHILPLPSASAQSTSNRTEIDEVAWTDRILTTMKYLDERAISALLLLSGVKQVRPGLYDHFLEACINHNGGVIDENEEFVTRRLNGFIQHLSTTFPDPYQAVEDLNAFAKLNEARLYKLMKTCMDFQTDLKSLVKATNEFYKRMDQLSSSHAPTLNILLRRSSFRLLNQSSIPTLIKRVSKGHGDGNSPSQITASHAQTLLRYISKHSPAMYKSHLGELTKAVADEKNDGLVETCLQAFAGLLKWDKKLVPADKRTQERITRFALSSCLRHAKFAARILAFASDNDACNDIVESIAENLPEAAEEQVVAHVAVLAQFAKFAPSAFEHRSEVVLPFLLKNILMAPSPADTDDMDVDEEWMPDENVTPALRAKLLCLKVCRNRSLAHALSDKAMEFSAPVMKLFATILEHNGSLSGQAGENTKFLSRMRLQAAVSLLHLSTVEAYANALVPRFLRLAVTIQDACYNVRIMFLTKLLHLLQPRRLPPRYNAIPFLTVHDPEDDVKATASSYIVGAWKKMNPSIRSEHLELIFVRLLHLLAHHPDFNKSHEDLCDIAKYIQFYLGLIATPDNVSLLYHLAMKCKTVRDLESHAHTEYLYVVSELAQELIKVHAGLRSWSVQSYPGKVRLPADILRPLPNPEAARTIMKTVYLPEETTAWLGELAKPSGNKASGSTKASTSKEKKERKAPKRKAVSTKANGHVKKARKERWRSDDESEEDEPSDFDSGEEAEVLPQSEEPRGTSGQEDEGREEKRSRGGRTTRSAAKAREKKLKVPLEKPNTDEE